MIIHRLFGIQAAVAIAFWSTAISQTNTKSDFLIVGEVRSLLIYNQYQQQLSDHERTSLLPFSPWRILSDNSMLGDGFTPCVKVEFDNKVFYIEKESDGFLAGTGSNGFTKTYRDAAVVGDTIEVLRDDRITVLDVLRRGRTKLDKGTRVERIFDHLTHTSVRILGARERFGWIMFDEATVGRDWRVTKETGISAIDQIEKALPRIAMKVEQVNAKLTEIYEYFNTKTVQSLRVPQWEVEQSRGVVVCVLRGDIPLETFRQSTQLLSKNIEGILLGTGMRVFNSPGLIEIRSTGAQ